MPAVSENLRRRLEKRSKRWVVGGHERRQKLCHRAHAAPLVAGEHANRHRSLCDQRVAVEQSEAENPSLGLVQAVEVRSVYLDVDGFQRDSLARPDPVENPSLRASESRSRGELDSER